MLQDENSKKVKIIDFGTSKLLEPGQQYQNIAGTPEFMAPEVVNYDDITTLTGRGSLIVQRSCFRVLNFDIDTFKLYGSLLTRHSSKLSLPQLEMLRLSTSCPYRQGKDL